MIHAQAGKVWRMGYAAGLRKGLQALGKRWGVWWGRMCCGLWQDAWLEMRQQTRPALVASSPTAHCEGGRSKVEAVG